MTVVRYEPWGLLNRLRRELDQRRPAHLQHPLGIQEPACPGAAARRLGHGVGLLHGAPGLGHAPAAPLDGGRVVRSGCLCGTAQVLEGGRDDG